MDYEKLINAYLNSGIANYQFEYYPTLQMEVRIVKLLHASTRKATVCKLDGKKHLIVRNGNKVSVDRRVPVRNQIFIKAAVDNLALLATSSYACERQLAECIKNAL